MTGFGEARGTSGELTVLVEVRTINNRHFKLGYRASDGYASLEPDVEAVVRQSMRRGTVQVSLRVERQRSVEDYRINEVVIEGYRGQLEALAKRNKWKEAISLDALLQLPGVIDESSRANIEPRDDWPGIQPVLQEALDAVNRMRMEEGAALLLDLAGNCQAIEKFVEHIAQRAPDVATAYQAKLAQRVNKAMEELKVTVDPTDLIREVSLFVDRSDISEEVVRLRSHLQQFAEALQSTESAGRKLEFIAQEAAPEINTIGSKANDAEISRHVVEVKSALERIREQIQNVE